VGGGGQADTGGDTDGHLDAAIKAVEEEVRRGGGVEVGAVDDLLLLEEGGGGGGGLQGKDAAVVDLLIELRKGRGGVGGGGRRWGGLGGLLCIEDPVKEGNNVARGVSGS
jgi:hypothetical protein